ncbi:META domain-containing protein [Longimicrobium sp.]|uniref:META domain-containing protein n=1 Tax=Longimicrobium sp. TaxID=2029185 RepID=UPI002B5D658B|nr:META domain-containing protein [Longimicrobium sp.]HSU15049.1 META domain-containing protein [Longimicrobium sp.]
MTRRLMGILLAAAALTALPGCHRNTNAAAGGSMGDIRERQWTLVEVNGRPAGTGAGGEAPTLQLAPDRASGFAGCNRFSSTYEMSGAALRFTAPVSTRMACAAGMELEQAYLTAIAATRSYRLSGGALELLGDGGAVLARFTAP